MSDKFKRIILKFGSGILARRDGRGLDSGQFARLTTQVARLVQRGHECLVVTSGAVAAGLGVLGLKERPDDQANLQACAAVGQSKLMQLYETMFARHGLHVAQLLVTHGDIDSRMRGANVKHTLDRLLASKIVPIINENDSVAVEELRFGDNDRLSAEVAMLARADLLILLTSVDGLMNARGGIVPVVADVDSVAKLANASRGKFSVGGMVSKLQAVKAAVEAGIPTAIANGRKPAQIGAIVAGRRAGTRFLAKGENFSAKDAK